MLPDPSFQNTLATSPGAMLTSIHVPPHTSEDALSGMFMSHRSHHVGGHQTSTQHSSWVTS